MIGKEESQRALPVFSNPTDVYTCIHYSHSMPWANIYIYASVLSFIMGIVEMWHLFMEYTMRTLQMYINSLFTINFKHVEYCSQINYNHKVNKIKNSTPTESKVNNFFNKTRRNKIRKRANTLFFTVNKCSSLLFIAYLYICLFYFVLFEF